MNELYSWYDFLYSLDERNKKSLLDMVVIFGIWKHME